MKQRCLLLNDVTRSTHVPTFLVHTLARTYGAENGAKNASWNGRVRSVSDLCDIYTQTIKNSHERIHTLQFRSLTARADWKWFKHRSVLTPLSTYNHRLFCTDPSNKDPYSHHYEPLTRTVLHWSFQQRSVLLKRWKTPVDFCISPSESYLKLYIFSSAILIDSDARCSHLVCRIAYAFNIPEQ